MMPDENLPPSSTGGLPSQEDSGPQQPPLPNLEPSRGSFPTGGGRSSVSGAMGTDLPPDLQRLVQAGLSELEQRKRNLQRDIDQLERRKERIEAEMRTSFAGASQDLAIRIQGFKEYLVGSLQDLADAADQLDLPTATAESIIADQPTSSPSVAAPPPPDDDLSTTTAFSVQRFEEQRERVRSLIDQYRTRPDYYGPPWQLRRTFEPIHADRVSNWFFSQGGRGAVKTLGSRLQNVLVASASISALYTVYGDRMCNLVLANTPERLGEWRRWLQDCLGISRTEFGTNRGIMLFESPEPMAQRAERLLENGRLPMIVIDASEDKVPLSLLQFPLWLAFAPDPANPPTDDYYY